jgi:hypothetical protein
MLLGSERNNELGQEILKYIRQKIQSVLDHYNQYVPAGTLATKGKEAQDKSIPPRPGQASDQNLDLYKIQAASLQKVKNDIPPDQAVLESQMKDPTSNFNPLQDRNIDIRSYEARKGFFLLMSGNDGAAIELPYETHALVMGSYLLDTSGSEGTGLKSITGEFIAPPGVLKNKVAPKVFTFKLVEGTTKTYKVDKFGYELGQLEINYLSLVEFTEPPQIDGELNLFMVGKIKKPTPGFLRGAQIDVIIDGRDILINTTLGATDLGNVGPIKVDEASLSIELSRKEGFRMAGDVGFSIPRAGSGQISASTKGKGFGFAGSFNFDPKTFEKGLVRITYDSTKDVPGKSPWTFEGTLTIKDKVKGIESATIQVGYANGELTFDGSANLSVPGVKSARIKGRYVNGQDFNLELGASFDFKNKYIQDPKIDVSLGAGGAPGDGGAGGDQNGGWRVDMSGSMKLNIPKLGIVPIAVSYNNGEFDAFANISDIKVGDRVTGTVTIGVTNKPVDPATGRADSGNGGGKELRLYGSGSITIILNDHLHPTLGVRLTEEGKVLINGNLTLDKQPLMKGDKLYGDDYPLFAINSPEIPVFSIGVGSVYIRFGGGADANYRIGIPLISAEVDLKDVDVHDPASMKVTTKITPEISASAGIKLWGSFTFGARVAVLKAEGTVTGSVGLTAEATFHPSLTLSWSPTEGLSFVGANVSLDAAIKAGVDLTGKVAVLLDFYFTSVNVWDKTWELGHMDLGELGKINLDFPLNFGKGGEPIPPKRLKPNTPFADQGKATEWMVNKPGGADKEEKGKSDEEIQKELEDDIRKLPALGPGDPRYKQMTSRDYVYHILKVGPINTAPFLRIWYDIEAEEFEEFKAHILQPASESKSKQAQIDEFAMNHLRVEPWKITILKSQVISLEASAQSSQAPVSSTEEFNSSPLPNPIGKI